MSSRPNPVFAFAGAVLCTVVAIAANDYDAQRSAAVRKCEAIDRVFPMRERTQSITLETTF